MSACAAETVATDRAPARNSPRAPQRDASGDHRASAPQGIIDPSRLNGDRPLSPVEGRAYVAYHRQRNAENARLSREEGIIARACPAPFCRVGPMDSPSRLMMHAFFEWAAREFARSRPNRPIRVLDIGCGTGSVTMDHLTRAGLRGAYVGLDVARHAKWSDEPRGGFTPIHVLGSAETSDLARMGPFDLVMSSTALEHIERPDVALANASAACAPDAWHIHFVPGEASLPLYGPHGWRYFSPRCLRSLFPHGEIYRFGGVASDWVHEHFVTPDARGSASNRRRRFNGFYRAARAASWFVDRVVEHGMQESRGATMYGVVVRGH